MSAQRREPASLDAALELITHGAMDVQGLLPGSSNYTFLATVVDAGCQALAVYKPMQGETPLWDFPHGSLCQREMAAYLVSEALGWGLVPPTVIRIGPYGKGAVQFFIDADFDQHYFTFRDDPIHRPALQRIAVFDLAINNADRKAGHCLLDHQGQVWAIDHGVCFHAQPKLRTVIWDFAGQPLPDEALLALASLQAQLQAGCDLHDQLGRLLSAGEVRALARRVEELRKSRICPAPDPHRRSYPWPLV